MRAKTLREANRSFLFLTGSNILKTSLSLGQLDDVPTQSDVQGVLICRDRDAELRKAFAKSVARSVRYNPDGRYRSRTQLACCPLQRI